MNNNERWNKMETLRNEYIKMVQLYKNELAVFTREKNELKALSEFYPTRSLDVKIANRKKKIKEYMKKYEETYHVQL